MSYGGIKVLGLSGEYSSTSKSGLLVYEALAVAKSKGEEIIFWDLNDKPLPFVGEEGCWNHPNVQEFQNLLLECDAFLVASPEYHGTMSGVMKNTFDCMYDKHVGGKVFGLMSTLGGMENSNTLNHMRIMVRWLHGIAVTQQLAIGHVKDAFDDVVAAREDKERLQNEAERYALTIVPEARGQAQARIQDAEGYRKEVVSNAEGEVARFDKLLEEYEKAPKVTRDRLYIDAMQSVLSNSTKVMVDVEGGNNLLYLPLDKIMEQNKKSEED